MIDPAAPLLFTADLIRAGDDPRRISRAVAAGTLVRVRRGAYCPAAVWREADERERHLMQLHVIQRGLIRPSAFAGYSAAAVWDLRLLRPWPTVPTMSVPYRGGGTGEPNLRRTAASWSARDATQASGLRVTTIVRTLIDVVRQDGLSGVGTLDDALRRGLVTPTDLADRLSTWATHAGLRRIRDVVGFADARAGSFGESLARVAIARAGFAPPVLQEEFVDADGPMFVDFFWPESRVVVEFDGRVKYTRQEFTGGDPSSVVWREKLREDRLRALGLRVVRVTSKSVRDPARLVALLTAAGLRRGHPSVRLDGASRRSIRR